MPLGDDSIFESGDFLYRERKRPWDRFAKARSTKLEREELKGPELKLCPECGVPEEQAKECLWLNSGVIVLASDRVRRQCLIESENLDPIFALLEETGVRDVYELVIEVARARRASRTRETIPPEVRGMLRNKMLSVGVFLTAMQADTRFRGFGDFELLDFVFEGGPNDHMRLRVAQAYSKPLFLGALVGFCEGFLDQRLGFTLSDISPDICEMTVNLPGEENTFLEPVREREYCYRDGDIELKRCGICGSPAALSGFTWHSTAGIIMNSSGLRVVLLDPQILDLIFEELERRSGKSVSRSVVEAQCQFIRKRMKLDHHPNRQEVRDEVALRGMGNLREFEMDGGGLRARIDNAACYRITVGSLKALFESAYDRDSVVDWEISENGDLKLEVIP